MDKIGLEGVAEELEKEGFAKESIDTYLGLFKEITSDIEGVRYCKEKLKDVLDPKVAEDLETIISTVDSVKTADFKMFFDPTLVRGMSYYTGPIFEISMDEFGGSVGGGGRYDEMIGKFTGNNTSACGFSIGFERIFSILMEHGIDLPNKGNKIAAMQDEGELTAAYKLAEKYRAEGKICSLYVKPKKMGKFLGKLEERGYAGFINVSNDDGISYFEN